MTKKEDKDRLEVLDKRLEKARKEKQASTRKYKQKGDRDVSKAYRIGLELVLAVMVGGAIGWYLDKRLGTTPWLFVIFFFLGVAAGFRNVYKAAQKIGGDLPPEQNK
ncbi:MAG: AtpZ/AtpI family protein [Proteobacteria bacterium]|nr:AtpZ/AtpI family protein [Pseudomonadota bacterium]